MDNCAFSRVAGIVPHLESGISPHFEGLERRQSAPTTIDAAQLAKTGDYTQNPVVGVMRMLRQLTVSTRHYGLRDGVAGRFDYSVVSPIQTTRNVLLSLVRLPNRRRK